MHEQAQCIMAELTNWAKKSREKWQYTGQKRPDFAVEPGENQESVWDYPRPPVIVADQREVIVKSGDLIICNTSEAVRILETAGAPTFYIPPSEVNQEYLIEADGGSWCEWKGKAKYWSVKAEGVFLESVAWNYPDPFPEYQGIANYFSFYPSILECCVDGEKVMPQPGGFYGGWLTHEIIGPIKGEPGSESWW